MTDCKMKKIKEIASKSTHFNKKSCNIRNKSIDLKDKLANIPLQSQIIPDMKEK